MTYWKDIAKSKMRKDDQVFFSKSRFGYYKKMQKMHASIPKGEAPCVAPFGAVKGRVYVELWDPNSGYGVNTSTFIPKNKIIRVRRPYKNKPK